jgi:hypothetical protein
VIDLGDERADPALLGEGWGPRKNCADAVCRSVRGEALLLAPLDVPEPLTLVLRARGEGNLGIAVNGIRVAAFALDASLGEHSVRVGADRFRRELNDVVLRLEPGAWAEVDRLAFERQAP